MCNTTLSYSAYFATSLHLIAGTPTTIWTCHATIRLSAFISRKWLNRQVKIILCWNKQSAFTLGSFIWNYMIKFIGKKWVFTSLTALFIDNVSCFNEAGCQAEIGQSPSKATAHNADLKVSSNGVRIVCPISFIGGLLYCLMVSEEILTCWWSAPVERDITGKTTDLLKCLNGS